MATLTLSAVNSWSVQRSTGIVTGTNPSKVVDSSKSIIVQFDVPAGHTVLHSQITDNILSFSGVGSDYADFSGSDYTGRQYYVDINCYILSGPPTVGQAIPSYSPLCDCSWSGEYWDGTFYGWEVDSKHTKSNSTLSNRTSRSLYVLIQFYYASGTNTGRNGSNNFKYSSVSLPLTYTTRSDKPTARLSPTSAYVNYLQSFNVNHYISTLSNIFMQYSVASVNLKYKLSSASSYSSSISSSSSTVTIPANTFTNGNQYNVQSDVTLDDGTVLTTSAGLYTTEDGDPIVTPISPNNAVIYGRATFRWSYSNERGTAQKAYELRYRKVGSSWTVLTKVTSQNTSAIVDIAESGSYEWSVRAYNQDDEVSGWTESYSFINNVPPNPPTITEIVKAGRPTIKWTASDQVAFDVEVYSEGKLYTASGWVYSADKTYKLDQYLPDGNYTFRVKIINSLGVESGWSEYPYNQEFSDLNDPSYELENTEEGVMISIGNDPTFEKYYVLRNGELIGSLTNSSSLLDIYAAGVTEYTVIGVTSSDESAFLKKVIDHKVRRTSIKLEDGTTIDASHRWNVRLSPAKTVNPEFGLYSYIGATRPEIITSKMRDIRYAFGFYDRDRIAETLIDQPLFYSDIFGNADWVQVTAISRNEFLFGNETTLELTVVQHSEDLDYDNT